VRALSGEMILDKNYFALVNLILFATCVSVILSQDGEMQTSYTVPTEKVH